MVLRDGHSKRSFETAPRNGAFGRAPREGPFETAPQDGRSRRRLRRCLETAPSNGPFRQPPGPSKRRVDRGPIWPDPASRAPFGGTPLERRAVPELYMRFRSCALRSGLARNPPFGAFQGRLKRGLASDRSEFVEGRQRGHAGLSKGPRCGGPRFQKGTDLKRAALQTVFRYRARVSTRRACRGSASALRTST
ncbi:hypothetical protein M885DRAFT_171691 [Pelagophyceae sp. CCMP2097]|nr:hypothetical protein M885DRAFT_171691 [Pelagophyceae sp. CCMP2097]